VLADEADSHSITFMKWSAVIALCWNDDISSLFGAIQSIAFGSPIPVLRRESFRTETAIP
jgi:hypothetical protein